MNEFPGMVLTGTGLVSPTGTGKNDFFKFLREANLPNEETGRRVELEPGQLLQHLKIIEPKLKIARYMDPVSKNAIVAVRAAMSDAGIEESQIAEAPYEYGIVFGTTRGACVTREGLYKSFASRQGKTLSGTVFSHCGYNIAGAMAAIAFGIKGPNLTVAGRADLGISVLRRASQILVSRRAHTVFAGFTECDGMLRRRNGSFGEMADVFCLERKDKAAERGAAVLAEVSVEPANGACTRGENRIVCGLQSRDAPLDGSAAELALSLPGMKAIGDRYASLIMIGLLSHDRSLKERFPAVAFTTSAGKSRTEVRLHYG
jgi:3-oxoacyl-(acyl-carrier-protein) synthase